MAYKSFNDLSIRTSSDIVLRDKTFNMLKILNMMGIKEVLD